MLAGNDGTPVLSILTVNKAKVSVEHHLVTIKGVVGSFVTTLPLILARISVNRQFRNPTLSQQGDIVVIVETSRIHGIAPPAMVSGVADVSTA